MTASTVSPAALAPREAAARGSFSLPTFWRLKKTDPTFPKVFKVSPGRSAVMTADFDAWLAAKKEAAQ